MKPITNNLKKPSSILGAPPIRPLITPGRYEGTVTDWKVIPPTNNRHKLAVQIDVQHGDELLPLTCFFNIDMSDENEIEHPKLSSKLSKTLRNIFPDQARNAFDLDSLVGLRVLANVVTSCKDSHRKLKHPDDHFSVVESFVSLLNQKISIQEIEASEPYDDQDSPF